MGCVLLWGRVQLIAHLMGGTCGQRVEVDLETFADELHLDDLGARGALGGIGAEKGHHETSKWGLIE